MIKKIKKTYMCEECFTLVESTCSYNFSDKLLIGSILSNDSIYCYCPNCKDYILHKSIDNQIAKSVSLLNKAKYNVESCCEGSCKIKPIPNDYPYIYFARPSLTFIASKKDTSRYMQFIKTITENTNFVLDKDSDIFIKDNNKYYKFNIYNKSVTDLFYNILDELDNNNFSVKTKMDLEISAKIKKDNARLLSILKRNLK